jgi:hypothetical protein
MSLLGTARRRLHERGLEWARARAQLRPARSGVGAAIGERAATAMLGVLDPWAYRTRFLSLRQALRIARCRDSLDAMVRLREALRQQSPALATLIALARPPSRLDGPFAGRSGRLFTLSTEVEYAGDDAKELTILARAGPDPSDREVGRFRIDAISPWTVRDHVDVYCPGDRREGITGYVRKRMAQAMPDGCRLINTLGGIVNDGLALLQTHVDEVVAKTEFGPEFATLRRRIDAALVAYGSLGRRPCEREFPESQWVEGLRPYLDEAEKALLRRALRWTLERYPVRIDDDVFAQLAMVKTWRRAGLEPVLIDVENLKVHFVKNPQAPGAQALDLDGLIACCLREP